MKVDGRDGADELFEATIALHSFLDVCAAAAFFNIYSDLHSVLCCLCFLQAQKKVRAAAKHAKKPLPDPKAKAKAKATRGRGRGRGRGKGRGRGGRKQEEQKDEHEEDQQQDEETHPSDPEKNSEMAEIDEEDKANKEEVLIDSDEEQRKGARPRGKNVPKRARASPKNKTAKTAKSPKRKRRAAARFKLEHTMNVQLNVQSHLHLALVDLREVSAASPAATSANVRRDPERAPTGLTPELSKRSAKRKVDDTKPTEAKAAKIEAR